MDTLPEQWIEELNAAGVGDYRDYVIAEAATMYHDGYKRAVREELSRAVVAIRKGDKETAEYFYYRADAAYMA